MARTKHAAVKKSKEQPKKKLQFARSPHRRAAPTGKPAPLPSSVSQADAAAAALLSARGAKRVFVSFLFAGGASTSRTAVSACVRGAGGCSLDFFCRFLGASLWWTYLLATCLMECRGALQGPGTEQRLEVRLCLSLLSAGIAVRSYQISVFFCYPYLIFFRDW